MCLTFKDGATEWKWYIELEFRSIKNPKLFNNAVDTLKCENEKLTVENSGLKKVVEKFKNGEENFEIMLGNQSHFQQGGEFNMNRIHLNNILRIALRKPLQILILYVTIVARATILNMHGLWWNIIAWS